MVHASQRGQAIRCYVCNSNQDGRCADPFLNATSGLRPVLCRGSAGDTQSIANFIARLGELPAAPPHPGYRPAACQKIDIRVLGRTVTGRGCSHAAMERVHPCNAFKLLATSELVLEFCGVCDTDACNGAASLASAALPALLVLLAM